MTRDEEINRAIEDAAATAAMIFQAKGWTWNSHGTGHHIPSRDQIEATLRELVGAIEARETFRRATGRLEVEADELHGLRFTITLTDHAVSDREPCETCGAR